MPFLLFVLSGLVLTLEVLETKIFAYSLENNLVFVVVAVVLLGFGAGGTILAMRGQLGEPRRLVRTCLWLTAVLLVLAHAAFAHFSPRVHFEVEPITIGTLLLLSSPYFTAGMAIAAILAAPSANVTLLYGVNLLGSALGCTTIFFLLGPLTAPQCLVLCATGAAVLAACLTRPRWQAVLGALCAGAILFALANELFPYAIDPGGQLALLRDNLAKIDDPQYRGKVRLVEKFDRWDPTARIQVHDLETDDARIRTAMASVPNMWFTQDSSYGSPLIGAGVNPDGAAAFFERTSYGIGYFRKRSGMHVLVIGLGGAPDMQVALHNAAASVDGVDINASAIAMASGPMSAFLGAPYQDPRVFLHIQDGRSFVRSTARLFDHIQLSGVDTKSVLAAGTLAVNESYLYTRQAFAEYLARLEPDGLLCIVYAGDDFMHRLAVSAMAAVAAEGSSQPWRHIMLARQNAIVSLLVKKTPFTDAECRAMESWLRACDTGEGSTGVLITVYELLLPGALSLRRPPEAVFIPDRPTQDRIMLAAVAGRLEQQLAAEPLDLAPVPDTRPFFFHLIRNRDILERPPIYFRRLGRMIEIMALMALLVIGAPLCLFRARGIRVLRNLPLAAYFAALGVGFILAEIGLIHRYVLFLGHQTYAFAVVIGGLLVAAGLGSMLAGRFQRAPHTLIVWAVAAICAALAALHLLLDSLFGATAELSLALRILVALAALVPLGVPLGMLFPTGLVLLRQTSPLFVPWAFGINGVFSVIGCTLVLPGAILFGFPVMGAAAAAVYVLAALAAYPVARRLAQRNTV